MLKDEYDRLLKLFHEGGEGKSINLGDVFSQSLEFFQHLKAQIENGTPEEKKEAMAMMSEMYKQLMQETQQITQRSGLSEDQLVAFADNPSNFTPEQWAQIQESKQKIFEAGQDLTHVIQELSKAPPSSKKDEKKGGPGKKSKKSGWMKS
jgi:hypothetical protein